MLAKKLIASLAGQSSASPIQFIGYNHGTDTGTAGGTYTWTLGAWQGGIGGALQENDFLLLCVTEWDTVNIVAGGSSKDYGPASGAAFTLLCDIYSNDNFDVNFYVGWRRCGVTPPTSIAMCRPDAANRPSQNLLLAYRGVNVTTGIDVTTTNATGINGSYADPPAITPVTAGAKIIAFGGSASQASLVRTPSASMTTRFGVNEYAFGGNYTNISGSETDWTGGAFNPAAWTAGSSVNTESWCAATVALRPV